jgi:putative transposase
MKRSKFSEAEIAFVLRQGEEGTAVGEVCRKAGISEATDYNWRKKYGGMMPSETKRLRQVADVSLDKGVPPGQAAGILPNGIPRSLRWTAVERASARLGDDYRRTTFCLPLIVVVCFGGAPFRRWRVYGGRGPSVAGRREWRTFSEFPQRIRRNFMAPSRHRPPRFEPVGPARTGGPSLDRSSRAAHHCAALGVGIARSGEAGRSGLRQHRKAAPSCTSAARKRFGSRPR